eukprot:m.457892 g.457892  ORF g.457892 m.457892 type:complete len:435 (-) comp21371_c0_seq1:53-1357(-)
MAFSPSLRALWLAQLLSLIGTDLTRFAVGVSAYRGSVSDYTWVTVCGEAPAFLLSPFTGILVDRVADKRALLFLSDAASLVASMWLWSKYSGGDLAVADIWAANIVQSIASSVQWPTFMATVTQLVNKDELVKVGAMNEAIPAAVMMIAPLIADFVLRSTNKDLTVLFQIELGTCIAASVALLWVQIVPSAAVPQPIASAVEKVLDDLQAPLRFLWSRPALRALLCVMFVCNFANGMVRVLFTPLIMAFGDTSDVATVLTFSGFGAFFGIAALKVMTPTRPVNTLLLCSAVQGLFLGAVGVRPSTYPILVVAVLYMALIPVVKVCRQAVFQHETPTHLLGRIFSLERAIREGCIPLSAAVAGPVSDYLENLMGHTDASGMASVCGPWVGVGKGRGVAMVFLVLGVVYTSTSLGGLLRSDLSALDTKLARKTKPE